MHACCHASACKFNHIPSPSSSFSHFSPPLYILSPLLSAHLFLPLLLSFFHSSSPFPSPLISSCDIQFDQLEQYVPKYLVYALLWAFSGDGRMKSRVQMGEFIRSVTTIPLPSSVIPIIDNEVRDTLPYGRNYISFNAK